ncbi:MAG: META domain-containing protein [Acidimicrobiales bacterium]|nr:META domain-containing protein [Acidimicrobiales bacterium]
MTDLTERLRRAAEGPPPGFGAADILRRVDRHRRRGRVVAASLLVLVVIGVSLVAARALGDGERGADRGSAGPIETVELTASPWILTAMGGDPVVGGEPEWVSFGPNGSVVGSTGCGPFIASWRWDGRALDIDDLDGRPDGCDRLEGSSLVGTPELIVGLLASDPVPGPSEITSGGLRLRSGTPDAAVPWIELTSFDDLDPVADDTAVTGRWITADGSTLQIGEETIDGETPCAAPVPWSLDSDGLNVPACASDVLGLTGAGPWEIRWFAASLWLRDGDRLAWLRRDIGSMPSGFDDLVGGRWIVRGMPGVQASTGMAWIELHDDGTVQGDNGACGTFEGSWTVDDDVLTGYDLRGPETSSCSPPPFDLQADLSEGLRLGRPDGASDQLQLHPASGQGGDSLPWVLRRFDRVGEAATTDDVVGMWEGQDARGWAATFSDDGTVEISASGCREVRPWSIADGAITIGDTADDACRAWVVQLPLPGEVDARIEGSTLWLSGEGGVVSAVRLA